MSKASLVYREGDEPVPGYRLVKLLGGGGVGKAWRAIAPGGVDVAVKIVERLQEGGGRRELQGLEQIKNIPHQYVCKIYGFWAKDAQGRFVEPLLNPDSASDSSLEETTSAAGEQTEAVQLVIAMELGDETLADVYARHRESAPQGEAAGIPVEQLLHHIETAGSAVDYLNCHHHICHCDIKPQNILIIGGEAKICDFGLARHVVDSKQTGAPAYTPQYGAPEMMVGATYHPRMDQYSLALTYAELRMGRFPFPAYTEVKSHSKLAALAREKWEGRHDLSGLPTAERNVLAKSLSPNPDDRFESIGQMLKALRAAVFPAQVGSPPTPHPLSKTSLEYREGDEPIPGYRITALLGEGAVGQTWRAVAPGGVDVALKIVNRLKDGGGQRELEGLERIKNIRHNHLCKTYGFWAKDADGQIVEAGSAATAAVGPAETAVPNTGRTKAVQLVIAMELGDETLADLVARYRQDSAEGRAGGIPVDELFRYIEAAGRAVDHLNQRYRICHCDLKPQNILLVSGDAKVCDFGLARQVVDARKTTAPAFTPQYGAPEMMVGAVYHPRMDQYSLALTYAELRAGRFPFPAFSRADSESQLAALGREKWEGKYDLSDLPKAERKVIAKALRPDPDDRFETIADMLEALERAIYARPRAGWLLKSAVAVLLVSLILGAWTAWSHRDWVGNGPVPDHGRIAALLDAVKECLVGFDNDRDLDQLDQAFDHLQKIAPTHQTASEVTDWKQRLANEYYRCAQKALDEYSEHGDSSNMTGAREWIDRAQSLNHGNKQISDWHERFARESLNLADQHLKTPNIGAATPYLAAIVKSLQAIPDSTQASLESRWAFYHARICAVRKDWEGVQSRLAQVESDALPVPSEDRARFQLLQVQLAVETERESLVGEAGMVNLESLRSDLDRLEAWEKTEARRIDAIGGELTDQARLDSSYDSWSVKRKQLAEKLWPAGDGFRTLFSSCLAWVRSDLADDRRKARAGLPKLRELAQTRDDQWHILVLEVLLNLKTPSDSESSDLVMSRFQEVLETEVPSGSPVARVDLFEALAARLEGDLRQRKTELLGLEQTRRLLSQDAVATGPHGDALDRRLRVLAVIAALEDDSTSAATIQTLAELLLDWVVSEDSADGTDAAEAERPWKALVAAAWVEAVLTPGQEEAFNEAQRRGIVDVVHRAPLDGVYGDYLRFVQSLLKAADQGERLKAADQVLSIFDSESLSPPLGTVRCRTLAVNLLWNAAHGLRTSGADGITTDMFTRENAVQASRYLDRVRTFWEQPPKVVLSSTDTEDLCDDFVLAYSSAGRDPQFVYDLADRRLTTSETGPILAVRARAARQRLEKEGQIPSNEVRNQVLRAHAGFLKWLSEHAPSRFPQIFEEFLAEALAVTGLSSLEQELQKMSLQKLAPLLVSRRAEIQKRVQQRDAVALIYWLHGRQLRGRFDETEAGLRAVLHAFAIASWLQPSAEYLVELGEMLLRLHSRTSQQCAEKDVVLKVTENLAEDALLDEAGYFGAYALQGHVRILRARGIAAADSERKKKLLDLAIEDYDAAVRKSPSKLLNRRYYVGKSIACLERAFEVGVELRSRFGCDRRAVLEKERRRYLDMAREAAEAALKLDPLADPPAEAWIAKGNAEEDLAFYVGDVYQFQAAQKSFDRAISAVGLGKASVRGRLGRGRSQLRQVLKECPVDGAAILKDKVIPELEKARKAAGGGPDQQETEPSPWLADIHFHLGEAYVLLYAQYRDQRDEIQEKAMDAYRQSVETARRTASWRLATYQNAWAEAALKTQDYPVAGRVAQDILAAANRGEVSLDEEFRAIEFWILAKQRMATETDLEEIRAQIDERLERFLETDPLLASRRVMLLYRRSVLTLGNTKPPNPLFEKAGEDARQALKLTNDIEFGATERVYLRGYSQIALGIYLLLKSRSADTPQNGLTWAKESQQFLDQGLESLRNYYAACDIPSEIEFRETFEARLYLGYVIFHLVSDAGIKQHSTSNQKAQWRQDGIQAIRSLRERRGKNDFVSVQQEEEIERMWNEFNK